MANELENNTAPSENGNNNETENWQNILKEFSDNNVTPESANAKTAQTAQPAQMAQPEQASQASATTATASAMENSYAAASDTETVNFTDLSNSASSYVVKPYKKSNAGIVILVVILIIAALGGVGYYLYTQDMLPFLSKKADYETAERAFINDALSKTDVIYDADALNYNSVDMVLKITPSDALAQSFGVEKLNETTITTSTVINDSKASMTAEYMNGAEKLLSGGYYADGNGSWAYCPLISDKYIRISDASSMLNGTSPYNEFVKKIKDIGKSKIDASVGAVMNTYFDSLGKVKDYTKEKVTVGELECEYKCANVEITDLVATDTAIAILTQLQTYPEITELTPADFYSTQSMDAFGDSSPINEKFSVLIQSAIDTLNAYKAENTTASDKIVTMKVYLDGSNKIVGRTIIVPGDSEISSDISISFIEANSGNKSAQVISITTVNTTACAITNNCTNNNGAYTGKVSITTGDSGLSVDIDYENLKEDNGFVTGIITITAPQMASEIKITLDALVNNYQFIEMSVNVMGIDYGKITFDLKMSQVTDVTLPDINDGNSVSAEAIDETAILTAIGALSQTFAEPSNGCDIVTTIVTRYLTTMDSHTSY